MRIAVDAMGGDHAPGEIVAGAALAAPRVAGEIILVGREDALRSELAARRISAPNLIIHHAPEVVEMDDSPMAALRQKADSSVTRAVELVREGEADGVVSAGNSGAFMAAATMRLGRLEGVQRPAIAVFMPTPSGKRIVLDAGANVDCKPEHLLAFGLMGSAYAEYALGIERPRVGLLSIGTEDCKGDDLTLQAARLLADAPVNFIGNVEGTQIYEGVVDVTVCDGFVGNVVLKVAEGVGHLIATELKRALTQNLCSKLGALLAKQNLRELGRLFDYAEYGGALLLGVNGVCVVSHGKSDARAMSMAIEVVARGVTSEVVKHMSDTFAQYAVPA